MISLFNECIYIYITTADVFLNFNFRNNGNDLKKYLFETQLLFKQQINNILKMDICTFLEHLQYYIKNPSRLLEEKDKEHKLVKAAIVNLAKLINKSKNKENLSAYNKTK